MENKDGRTPEFQLLILIGLGIVARGVWVGYVWFRNFIEVKTHLYCVCFIGLISILFFAKTIVRKWRQKKQADEKEKSILAPEQGAVYCGHDEHGDEVFIKTRQRSMHTQVIGTTNAGKTESVILPWAIQDIKQGRGLILIDGKADNSLLEKIWGYTVKAGREKDFKLFSLSHLDASYPFNPLIGGTAEEITERVFNAFEFENPYYRALQYEVMGQLMRILEGNGVTPTFERIYQMIVDIPALQHQSDQVDDTKLRHWVERFRLLSNSDRDMRTSGLLSSLGQFSQGKTASLFNSTKNAINLDEVLAKNQIVYFQLPVLLSPFLGKATGKLILQSLQAAVANRHRGQNKEKRFFSVFLDDFSEYLYPGFVSILNKSRSANIGIVFAHQALGDIQTLGEPIANAILTNSNLKIFMRGNDPDSAEYFSKVIGTKTGTKFTERQTTGMFNSKQMTGEKSVRDVEEFMIHPNAFKRDLGVGQAIMLVPHDAGIKTVRIKFDRFPDVSAKPIPMVEKPKLELLDYPKPQPKTTDSSDPKTESDAPTKAELGLGDVLPQPKDAAEYREKEAA
jgi:type IV secretory pathway TraG/TraD family ATPase VirD4